MPLPTSDGGLPDGWDMERWSKYSLYMKNIHALRGHLISNYTTPIHSCI